MTSCPLPTDHVEHGKCPGVQSARIVTLVHQLRATWNHDEYIVAEHVYRVVRGAARKNHDDHAAHLAGLRAVHDSARIPGTWTPGEADRNAQAPRHSAVEIGSRVVPLFAMGVDIAGTVVKRGDVPHVVLVEWDHGGSGWYITPMLTLTAPEAVPA